MWRHALVFVHIHLSTISESMAGSYINFANRLAKADKLFSDGMLFTNSNLCIWNLSGQYKMNEYLYTNPNIFEMHCIINATKLILSWICLTNWPCNIAQFEAIYDDLDARSDSSLSVDRTGHLTHRDGRYGAMTRRTQDLLYRVFGLHLNTLLLVERDRRNDVS